MNRSKKSSRQSDQGKIDLACDEAKGMDIAQRVLANPAFQQGIEGPKDFFRKPLQQMLQREETRRRKRQRKP
jgi:hypothetical protein